MSLNAKIIVIPVVIIVMQLLIIMIVIIIMIIIIIIIYTNGALPHWHQLNINVGCKHGIYKPGFKKNRQKLEHTGFKWNSIGFVICTQELQ